MMQLLLKFSTKYGFKFLVSSFKKALADDW